jgi:hypothetical protein
VILGGEVISKASKQEAALRQGRASTTDNDDDDDDNDDDGDDDDDDDPLTYQPRRSCESVRCRKPLWRGS